MIYFPRDFSRKLQLNDAQANFINMAEKEGEQFRIFLEHGFLWIYSHCLEDLAFSVKSYLLYVQDPFSVRWKLERQG